MKISKKLSEWQQENLIDAAIVEKINEYESHASKPIALWVVGGLGVFAVIVGIVSVIASNWQQTPAWVKLFAALLICLCVATALYRVARRNDNTTKRFWVQELLVIFYYGFVLAAMALIGQTYQLGGGLNKLFLAWTLATIPLVLLGRGKFLATLWMIGIGITYFLNIEVLYDVLEKITQSEFYSNITAGSLCVLTPVLFILVSRIPWLYKNRPLFSEAFSTWSWFAIILMGWFSQFFWYDNANLNGSVINYITLICFLAVVVLVLLIPKLYANGPEEMHLAMRIVLITVLVLSAVGAYFWQNDSSHLIGALSNLVYLCVLGWAALKIKSIGFFNTVTALICLRIIAIYLEVFGTMFDTGIGLIIGGVLTLFIAWWWFKKSDALASRLTMAGDA
ncbi:DUF2157 domain-containing protein [Colwellia sp. MB3u-70]|uniref:DUF2157 domain-containing protein n=1 Tax=unclassified Colwellia TaxID=196834 RepID=UPI0015F3A380|nr:MULTISPECIES: DUF2157 domain-containing protein [unclassified Colwellia]MBA6291480.1 DUF2157 domain-containing protein [Colwellia sp. MB3u-8]MBA6305986.1 DUF2157 domain-containing protein [Colwellia sp. MB3u-70]